MDRLSPAGLTIGAIVIGLAGFLAGRAVGPFKGAAPAEIESIHASDAGLDAGRDASEEIDAAPPPPPPVLVDAGPYAKLIDGTAVPPIPANAPKHVRFGVVLVTYAGADPGAGPPDGPKVTRSRVAAKALAETLADTAKTDFHAAVQQGDPGSADDLGKIHPGILEPAADYVLFTLPAGGVGGPVETPRGFWIVKRID